MGCIAPTWTLDPGAHGATDPQLPQGVRSIFSLYTRLQGLRNPLQSLVEASHDDLFLSNCTSLGCRFQFSFKSFYLQIAGKLGLVSSIAKAPSQ